MPRQKGILPLPLIIYTSFFFFPSSPRETVTHNFLIRYRVLWKKEEWKKDLLTKPKYGRRNRSADIPSQRVHRDASSLRNRLISFSSSVASLPSLHLRSNENFPLGFFPKSTLSPPLDFARRESGENFEKFRLERVYDRLRKYSTGSVRSNCVSLGCADDRIRFQGGREL